MIILSQLPVSDRFKTFWKQKDLLISLVRSYPEFFSDLEILSKGPRGNCPYNDDELNDANDPKYFLQRRGWDGRSEPNEGTELLKNIQQYLQGQYDADTQQYSQLLKKYEQYPILDILSDEAINLLPAYLEYETHADEINNAIILHAKQDSTGRLQLGRAEKEVLKICRKNALDILNDSGWADSTEISDEAKEVIYGSIVMKHLDMPLTGNENNGLAFEELCRSRLNDLGFETSLTKPSGDFGGDIVAEKHGITYIIQCKATSGKVGVKAIQEAATAKRYYKADAAVVITNGEYTSAANELAVENKVILIRDSQISLLEKLFA